MTRTRSHVGTWFGISLSTLSICAAADNVPLGLPTVNLDMKAQPIGAALNELAQASGMQILFYSDAVNALDTPALAGAFTPVAALERVLANTGLTYSYVNARTVEVHRQADANPTSGETSLMQSVRSTPLTGNLRVSEVVSGTQAQTDSRRADPPDSGTRRRNLEEVVVTAQKRTERLQDVPLSIAVVSARDIDRRGLVNSEDYLRGLPGVNQTDSGWGQSIVIRGTETSTESQTYNSGATVATYFGETPTTNTAGLGGGTSVDLKLVDIERVEILRGPQGTAFGNSSLGGAVRTIPVAPKLNRLEGKVAGGYSVTADTGGDNYNIQAVANFPIVDDRLAIRAVAYQYQDSGFYRNRAKSDAAFQTNVVARYAAQAFAADADEVGSYRALGGRIAALYQVSDDLRLTLTYTSQNTETDGFALSNSGVYEQTLLQVAPENVARGRKDGLFDTQIEIANATLAYDFGWADLLATYSYISGGSTNSLPFGFIGSNIPMSYGGSSNHLEHVGEVRLVTKLDGAWNFLVGLYSENLKDDVVWNYYWHGDPATNPTAPGAHYMGVWPDTRDLQQIAAFGEVSWKLLSTLTLTTGVRAYGYDRNYRVDAVGALFGANGIHRLADTDASDSNLRANLSYKPNDDMLLYAGWSQGFRLGRPQGGLPADACDPDRDGLIDGTSITLDSTGATHSDSVDSYELGSKLSLFDRRATISAAVFRTDWSDIPITQRVGSSTCRVFVYGANAGTALLEGAELQGDYRITDALRISGGASWLDARLTRDVPAQNISKNSRLPGSPQFSANLGFQYDFQIGRYNASVRADSIYVGSFFGNLQESPSTQAGDYVKVDASARLEIGSLALDLIVRNLTNEDAFTFRGARDTTSAGVGEFYGYRLRPRTIGVQLGYSF